MKRDISLWQFVGFGVTSLLGTLLHFLYDWLGKPLWIAPFSGVNESTFEHMKLLFWPMFLFALLESFFFRERRDFFCVKMRGIILGITLIPVIFYTYNGVIGKSPDSINILIFFITAAVSFIYETYEFKKNTVPCKKPRLALAILIGIGLLFVIFTFKTPKIAIFKDPLTGAFGI